MQPTMKTMFLLSFLFVLLAGCLPSKNPASDPDKDEIDQSLIGTWTSNSTDANGTKQEHRTTISRPPQGTNVPKGVLLVDGLEDGKKVTRFIIPTTIGAERFFSSPYFDDNLDTKATAFAENWKPEMGWNKDRIKGYWIIKYEIKNSKLVFYLSPAGCAKLRNDIETGKIHGESGRLAESTEGLRKYIKDNESSLFIDGTDKEKVEWTRAEKGCAEKSQFPASDPDKDEIDQSLIGTWLGPSTDATSNKQEQPDTISRPPQGSNAPKGVLFVESEENDKKVTHFVIPTTIGNVRYLSSPCFDEKYKPEMGWNKDHITGYSIIKYEIKNDKLTMLLVNPVGLSKLADAIKKGEIRGKTENDGPELAEPTEGLRTFIKDNETWLFTDKYGDGTRVAASGSAGSGTIANPQTPPAQTPPAQTPPAPIPPTTPIASTPPATPPVAAKVLNVSLVQIIVNPKHYHNKVVRVTGFVSLEFEGNAIYVRRDDYNRNIYKNALWIDVSDDIQKEKARFEQKYVLVEGTFNANAKGHMNLFGGSIHDITRFEVSRSRRDQSKEARFELYLLRGNDWFKKGEYNQALTDFNEALQLNPNCAETYYGGGQARYAKGEYNTALADFNEALRLNPNYAEAYCGGGQVRCAKGEYDIGIADYNQALAIDPSCDVAYDLRGTAWMGKGEYDKGIADFNQALAINPQYARVYYKRTLAWKGKGEYDKAIADYNQALAINPNHTSVCNELGWMYATCPDEKCRDGQKAYTNANKAYQLSGGKDWTCIDTLAAAYAECGDFDAAKEWQAKAIDLATAEKDKAECRSRLELYRQRKPYREEPKRK